MAETPRMGAMGPKPLPPPPPPPPNRGWKSTKLHLSLITMGLMTLAYYFAATASFDAYCNSLLFAAGIYTSAAAAEKFSSKGTP